MSVEKNNKTITTLNKILGFICLLSFIALTISITHLIYLKGQKQGYEEATLIYEQKNNSCAMRFPEHNITGIKGVYHHPDYYCVWTGKINGIPQTPAEIAEVTFHELAHYYAHHDPKHFNVE